MKVNGKHIREFGLYMLEGHSNPLNSGYRDKTLSLPDVPGLKHMDSKIQPKLFSVPLGIPHRDNYDLLRNRVDEFLKQFFDEYGKKREVTISFDYDSHKEYFVKLGSEPFDLNRRRGNLVSFELQLIAYDPFAYSTVFAHEINWDSTVVTFDDDYSFDTVAPHDEHITENTTVEVYVNGYAFYPRMTLNGTGNDVTFSMNGREFTVDLDGELIIDGSNFTVMRNGMNVFDELEGDFLELLPGENKLQISGTNMDFILSIPFQDRFM